MKKSIATALIALAALPAGAAPVEWNGLGGTTNWSDAGNWTPGVPPNDGTANILHTTPGLINSPVVDAAWAINSLVVPSYNSITLTGSSLTFQGPGAILSIGNPSSIANALVFDVFVSVEVGTSLTLAGGITGMAGLTKNLAGDLTIANNLIYTGMTTVAAGTLRLGDGVSGPPFVNMVVNNAAMAFNVPGGISLNGPFSGTGSVTVEGGSVASFAGTMLHAGTTTINAGALLGASLDNNALLTVNGQFDTGAATVGSLTGTGTITNNGLIQVGGDGTNASFTGPTLFGAGMFTKVGGGNQVLAHVNTYTALTTVSGGTLTLGNGVTGPPFVNAVVNNAAMAFNVPGGISLNGPFSGTGSVTVEGGSVASFAGTMLHAGTTTINAGALLSASLDNNALLTVNGQFDTGAATVGSLTGTGTITNNGLIQVGGDGTNASFTGPTLFGAGMFTKVGGGNQVLAHVNTYTALTTVSGGTLTLGNGVTGPPFVNAVVNNAAMAFNVPGGISLNGPFSGTGSVTVEGGSVICSCGTMLHAGTTTINAGALLGSSLSNNALLTVNGTFDTGATTAGSLTGTGTFNINGGNAIIGGDNTNTTFGGVLASNGIFAKVGTGTLTLTGVSTLTGASAIVSGRLLVNGTLPGLVVVGVGATLGGTGIVGSGGGSVQVNAGGTLAPGLSPGVLNTGNVILAGVLLQEIDGPALGAQYDNVSTTGTVNVTGATLTLAGVYVPVAGNNFTIISNDGADPIVGTFAGLPEGATIVFNGVTLQISYVGGTGNDVVLAVVAPAFPGVGGPPIPTLSEWMLVLLALLMMTIGLRSRSFRNNR